MSILAMLGLFILAVGLFAMVMNFYIKFLTRIFVEREAALLTEILDTGAVPPQWRIPYVKKVERMKQSNVSMQAITRVEVRAKRKYIAQMRRIQSYAGGTPLLTEEKRASAIARLDQIAEKWEKGEYE